MLIHIPRGTERIFVASMNGANAIVMGSDLSLPKPRQGENVYLIGMVNGDGKTELRIAYDGVRTKEKQAKLGERRVKAHRASFKRETNKFVFQPINSVEDQPIECISMEVQKSGPTIIPANADFFGWLQENMQ